MLRSNGGFKKQNTFQQRKSNDKATAGFKPKSNDSAGYGVQRFQIEQRLQSSSASGRSAQKTYKKMELKPTPRSEWAVENFADALGASETKGRDNASTAVICERVNGGPVEAESLSLADMCLTPLLFSPASPLLPSFPPFPRCLLSSGPVLCLTASRFDVLLRLELDGGLCAVPTSVFCRPMVTHVLCRCIFPHAWCRCGVTNSCVLFHCRGLEALPDLIVCQNLKKLELGSNKLTSIEVQT